MSKFVRSKKRILSICHVQGKVAERDYLGARKKIVRLEKSSDQLRVMADQMLDTRGNIHSAMLAAKMEFGYRLIMLNRLQRTRIDQNQRVAETLLSEAHLSRRKEDRAACNFRQAAKSCDIRQQHNQARRTKCNRNSKRISNEGTTA